jgi:hypothetical protein
MAEAYQLPLPEGYHQYCTRLGCCLPGARVLCLAASRRVCLGAHGGDQGTHAR